MPPTLHGGVVSMNNQITWKQQPFQSKPKSPKRPVSFVEALKSIGNSTVNSLKNDAIKGTLSGAMDSFFSPGTPTNHSNEANFWPNEATSREETQWRQEQARRERHREVMTPINIFDRHEEELKAQITSLQEQLKALAQDITNLSTQTVQAINAEIAKPGTYHINFFEKLRQFIVLLRKQVAESRNWLELSYARKRAKNSFWAGFTQSGTKFSLSSERYTNNSAG